MPTFHEYSRRGWALISQIAYVVAVSVASGAAIGFLVLVYLGVVGPEILSGMWSSGSWDPVWRAGVGAVGIVIVAAAGIAVTFFCIARLAFAQQLARTASSGERRVPSEKTLAMLELPHPFASIYIFALLFLVIDGFFLLLLGLALGETFRHNVESAREGSGVFFILLGAAVLMVFLMVLARFAWKRMWTTATILTSAAWPPPLVKQALARIDLPKFAFEKRVKSLANWFSRAGGLTLVISGAIFMLAVWIRQPGRFAETRYYDDPGEAFIDFLVWVSAVFTSVALVTLTGALLAHLARYIRDRRRLAQIADGLRVAERRRGYKTLDRGDSEMAYADFMAGPSPAAIVGATLVGLGWGNVPFFAATNNVVNGAWPDWVIPTFVALGIAGAGLLLWANSMSVRYKNRLRAAWG